MYYITLITDKLMAGDIIRFPSMRKHHRREAPSREQRLEPQERAATTRGSSSEKVQTGTEKHSEAQDSVRTGHGVRATSH